MFLDAGIAVKPPVPRKRLIDARGARHQFVKDGLAAFFFGICTGRERIVHRLGQDFFVPLASNGIACCRPRRVLQGDPGLKNPGEFDNAKHQHQQDRQRQRKLDHRLPAPAVLARGVVCFCLAHVPTPLKHVLPAR